MIAAEWARVKQRDPAWYWVCDAAHYGDLYQVCAFAAAFRDHHGWKFPLHLIATSRTQAEVAALFGPCFDAVIVAPGLQGSVEAWNAFYTENSLPCFGLDTPIMIYTPYSPAIAGLWNFAMERNAMTVLPLIRRMLQLPNHVEPRFPPLAINLQARAQALCEENGIIQGRSVILCPFARSEQADATVEFTLLAGALLRAGYSVFTSVAGDETAIAETAAVEIPFSLLPEVAGYAGWVIALRSGVADVVSSAVCRKSIIYQSFDTLRNWSLAVLGLCPSAHELVFRFGTDAPERLVDAVVSADPTALPGFGLSDMLGPDRSICFPDLDLATFAKFLRGPKFKFLGKNKEVLRITGIPPSRHVRIWNIQGGLMSMLAKSAEENGWQLLACRDGSAAGYFEPVETTSLADRQYYFAGYWHTLLVIRRPPSDPGALSQAMLPRDAVTFGADICPADALGNQRLIDSVTGHLPFCHGGLQFLEGWSDLEYWGIWSLACLSTLKILLPVAPAGQLVVQLEVTVAALTIRMPSVSFTVTANEAEIGCFELSGMAELQKLELLVPAHVIKGRRALMLRFRFPYTLSPLQQGGGASDARPIALGLHRLRVDPR